MECYSAIKKNAFESAYTKWINLEPIIPSIVSQKERKQISYIYTYMGFPGGSEVKASASNEGDLGSILGLGRSPGEGNGNALQYSCLENPMDRGAWQAIVHGVAKSQT